MIQKKDYFCIELLRNFSFIKTAINTASTGTSTTKDRIVTRIIAAIQIRRRDIAIISDVANLISSIELFPNFIF